MADGQTARPRSAGASPKKSPGSSSPTCDCLRASDRGTPRPIAMLGHPPEAQLDEQKPKTATPSGTVAAMTGGLHDVLAPAGPQAAALSYLWWLTLAVCVLVFVA